MALTRSDLAKYPFTLDAAEFVKLLDLRIENLESDDYKPIVERAEERLRKALSDDWTKAEYSQLLEDVEIPDVEIPSFPLAVMMAAASGNEYIKRRYALFEAKRAYEIIRMEEKLEKILEIARAFDWKVRIVTEKVGGRKFDFALSLRDFLRNTGRFHEKEWKLVNKILLKGEVYLTKHEVSRLLQEEIQRRIERRLNPEFRPSLPESILERVERLKQEYSGKAEKAQLQRYPDSVVNEAFPPCISQMYGAAKSGSHLSHIERFALTSFLLNIGMKPEDVINLFRSSADFNERMTRYQVEHISGERGSRTRYVPPTCETLKTHGVCPVAEGFCGRFRHPLIYYRKKTGRLKSESTSS